MTFKPETMRQYNGDVYYITSSELQEYSHLIYGDDVTVEYFASDTLFFTFPEVDYKKVPVHPVSSVSYKEQYTGVGELKVVPDSITVYGELNLIENIDRVYTQPLKLSGLNVDVQGFIALEPISDIRFSATQVSYSQNVSRYVEIKTEVRVDTKNVPADKEMVLLPSRIQASLKCFFPLKGEPAESMELYVDYADFEKSVSGKCPVRSSALPEGVISYELDPFYVECIVRDR